jgi:FAD:protein FMN transferase
MKYFPVAVLVALSVALLGVFFYVRSHSRGVVEVSSDYRVVMGTYSQVVVIARSERTAQRCIEAAFDVQEQIESLMSDYRDDSELSRVNREAARGPVPVSAMTFEVLQKAVHFSELSDGAFDVTIGPLVDLWHKAGETNEPPTEAALAEARRKVGSDKLILDAEHRTVRFAVEGMRVDVGAIGKGYAADQSVAVMKKHGALGGMAALAGDIRCFGRPPRGQESWRIGLQDPNVAANDLRPSKPLLVLALTDQGVSTSGDYRRFVKVQGRRHSHIVNPHTGESVGSLVSDTIIAPDATTSDALSTAVNVLGAEKGLALVERLPSIAAILIPADGKVTLLYSSGAKAYVTSTSTPTPTGADRARDGERAIPSKNSRH